MRKAQSRKNCTSNCNQIRHFLWWENVAEFGASLDFNVTTFMENGTWGFHNHEDPMLIWAVTPLTAGSFPDISAGSRLSAAPSLHISNATSCVIWFSCEGLLLTALPHYFAHSFWWNHSQDNTKHSTKWRGGKHLVLQNSLKFVDPQRRTFW